MTTNFVAVVLPRESAARLVALINGSDVLAVVDDEPLRLALEELNAAVAR